MQTIPFFKEYRLKSKLPKNKLTEELIQFLINHSLTFNQNSNFESDFKFYDSQYMQVRGGNSFNPIYVARIIKDSENKSILIINARIAYPVYFFFLLLFGLTFFAHITLTIGSYESDGILGILFTNATISIFYFGYYIFFRFGYKNNRDKILKNLTLTSNFQFN